MQITQIKIKNFRLLKDVEFELNNDLNVIVGKNNSGKTSILYCLDKFLNNTYKVLSPILYLNQDECNAFVNDNYSLTDNVSIDYSVMEKYNNIFVIEGNFGWDDVGSWSSIDRYSKKDVDGNVLNSAGVLMKSNNNTILTKKKILLNNVNDLIIVETDDYIVVSSKKHAQDIRFAQDYM